MCSQKEHLTAADSMAHRQRCTVRSPHDSEQEPRSSSSRSVPCAAVWKWAQAPYYILKYACCACFTACLYLLPKLVYKAADRRIAPLDRI